MVISLLGLVKQTRSLRSAKKMWEVSFMITCNLSPHASDSDEYMDDVTKVQKIISRAHWIKCDTSYTSFTREGHVEHHDDWSSSKNLAASAFIQGYVHMFFLE